MKAFSILIAVLISIPAITFANEGESHSFQPIRGVAGAVVDVGKGTTTLVKETATGVVSKKPLQGLADGVQKGSEAVVHGALKGAYRAATLGLHEAEEIRKEDPVYDSGSLNPEESKPTTFTITLPWQ